MAFHRHGSHLHPFFYIASYFVSTTPTGDTRWRRRAKSKMDLNTRPYHILAGGEKRDPSCLWLTNASPYLRPAQTKGARANFLSRLGASLALFICACLTTKCRSLVLPIFRNGERALFILLGALSNRKKSALAISKNGEDKRSAFCSMINTQVNWQHSATTKCRSLVRIGERAFFYMFWKWREWWARVI